MGIIYGLYLKQSIALTIILLVTLIFLIYTNKKRVFYFFIKRKKSIMIILISIIISFLYTNYINNKFNQVYIKTPKDLNTYATIVSEAHKTKYYYSYEIKIKDKKFLMYTNQKLDYGMYISLKGEYNEPQEQRNYKGFNYKEYLKTKKIYGSINAAEINIEEREKLNIILMFSNTARNKIINVANKILPEDTASILEGVLIGEKYGISHETRENFSKSNLSHILAISGTHVSYIILGITFVLIKSKSPKKVMYIITILTLIFFMFITGFSPSVIRACIVAIIMVLSKILHRKFDSLSAMAFSLLISFANNPFLIKDIGLQLSYLGALGIILFYKPIVNSLFQKINKKIAEMIAVTVSAQILIFPIIVLNFNNLSTVFILSNIIAVPLAGVIILFGYVNVLIGMISLKIASILGVVLNVLIKLLLLIAEYMGKLPLASITVTTPSIAIIMLYYFMIFYIYFCVKSAQSRRSYMGVGLLSANNKVFHYNSGNCYYDKLYNSTQFDSSFC